MMVYEIKHYRLCAEDWMFPIFEVNDEDDYDNILDFLDDYGFLIEADIGMPDVFVKGQYYNSTDLQLVYECEYGTVVIER